MRIILSRKGFDSAYGGYPSPILPDGKLISLPIPSVELTKYSNLRLNDKQTYFDLMKQLNPKIKYNQKWHELDENTECHLDPDLYSEIIPRLNNWKPCFGQINQAQSHLLNEGVKEDDLFLFFGWFKRTILKNGFLQFDKSAPDLHILFGYLQVGERIQVNNQTKINEWMQSHPHAKDEERRNNPTNTIYVARSSLNWDKNKASAGVFMFDEKLVLTKKGFTRTKWDLPDIFRKVKISRHSEKSWKGEGYFKSVDIGQEFVIEEDKHIEGWAIELINSAKII